MELLQEHLILAILLGGIASLFIEGIKNKEGFNLTGWQLGLFANVTEVIVATAVGIFYLGVTGTDLVAVVIWVFVGAEAMYAGLKPILGNKDKVEGE